MIRIMRSANIPPLKCYVRRRFCVPPCRTQRGALLSHVSCVKTAFATFHGCVPSIWLRLVIMRSVWRSVCRRDLYLKSAAALQVSSSLDHRPRPSTTTKKHTRQGDGVKFANHINYAFPPLLLETYRPSNSIMIKKMYNGIHVLA